MVKIREIKDLEKYKYKDTITIYLNTNSNTRTINLAKILQQEYKGTKIELIYSNEINDCSVCLNRINHLERKLLMYLLNIDDYTNIPYDIELDFSFYVDNYIDGNKKYSISYQNDIEK